MSIICTLKRTFLFFVFFTLASSALRAADESYVNTLFGKIKKGDELTVVDDKFQSLSLEQWNQIRNISVENIISFELRHDTAFNYFGKPFSCTLNFSVKYFTSKDQQEPTQVDNISLVVKYDTASSKFYPVDAQYTFKNAFKVTIVVNSISSPEWKDQLPDIFRIKNQIQVKRKYPFTSEVNASLSVSGGSATSVTQTFSRLATTSTSDGKVVFSWSPADFPGAEEYDVEWTYVDSKSDRARKIASLATGGYFRLSTGDMKFWMDHDNTRVTVSTSSYSIQLPYTDGYVLARVRGISYNDDNLRLTTNWQYQDADKHAACVAVTSHEPELNWQYTGTFAEDGKHKQVVTYFDGSLRNRKAVTLNNTTGTAVVAETIYDPMGRGTISVLPAPVNSSKIAFNIGNNISKFTGLPYNHKDITLPGSAAACSIGAQPMDNSSGAANYYSANNPFLSNGNYSFFTKYVPNADGFPFAVTEYTPDNTGRIRRQGGVGHNFQIGSGHETQYFYSKPLPRELERLFGMEVGIASHYQKNIVIDPNSQISVSYIDASGKTIATALEGGAPERLDALPSSAQAEAKTHLDQVLIRPMDIQKDPSALQMSSTAVFFAAVAHTLFKVHYHIDPASISTVPAQSPAFCSNCYYEVKVKVTNDCGAPVAEANSQPFSGNDVTCHNSAAVFTGDLEVPIEKIGEYTVNYSLQLSQQVINAQVDYYISHNTDLKSLQNFFQDEMLQADLKGCYSECNTCMVKLGTRSEFTTRMYALLQGLKETKFSEYNFDLSTPEIYNWIYNTYTDLLAHCQAIAGDCKPMSPCEQKLEMLKSDVRPGGQYALYDETNFTVPSTDQNVSVLLNYKTDDRIPNYEFIDENGQSRHIKDADVTQDVFIKAYIQHPEWADAFVLKHIEYCSYQWCKDQSNPNQGQNNEVSYIFDETLKDQVTTGTQAIAKGYYNRSNFNALVDADPFFNGGYGSADNYKDAMKNDLSHISDVLQMTMKDQSGRKQATKNIFELLDWILYCKPTAPNSTPAEGLASWNSCSPDASCRSTTAEWELYRNYYLQLKGKYMQLAKQAHLPTCVNCFVGDDGFSALDCSNVVPPPPGNCPDPSEFSVTSKNVVDNSGSSGTQSWIDYEKDIYFTHSGGPVTRDVSIDVYKTSKSPSGYGKDGCLRFSSVRSFDHTEIMHTGEESIYLGHTKYHEDSDDGCLQHMSYSTFYSAVYNSCLPYTPPSTNPGSLCKADPRYNNYKNKMRIFNEYVDMSSYTNCMLSGGLPSQADPTATAVRQQAIINLDNLKTTWKDRLVAVVKEEPAFSSIDDITINNIVNNLYEIAKLYINTAPADHIRAASSLPSGQTVNGFNNFKDVFIRFAGATLVKQGFGPELINQPYPYDKDPVMANSNSGELTGQVKSNITSLNTLYNNSGAGNDQGFHRWLKSQLQDDYVLTFAQLMDVKNRSNNGCRYLSEPVMLPVAFTAPAGKAFKSCNDINGLLSQFASDYSLVPQNTKLYRVLLTNYLNFRLGYALSYDEYTSFAKSCKDNSSIVLYNKPASPLLMPDDDACTVNILAGIFDHAGQEYVQYIEQKRKEFRNQLVSKCLSANTSVSLEGDQYEYHYTLYYYDQSGNLVKTIPPEGVKLLTNEEMDLLEQHLNDDAVTCNGVGVPNTEDHAATYNAFSTALQNNIIHGMEMWWYDHNNGNRQVRFVTPDQKFFYQAAIANKKLWVEMYQMEPATGEISLVQSNKAVVDISSIPVQSWSHLFVQTPFSMLAVPPPANTALTLGTSYTDATPLTNVANNFTLEMWVNPTSTHEVDVQGGSRYAGVNGQKYVFMPPYGGDDGVNAGVGVSVGTNGISVYEHSYDYMPATLVWKGTLNGWNHIAIVYSNKTPQLYVNGSLVQTGMASPKASVYPGIGMLGGSYGIMNGQVDEVRIWNYPRSQSQIQSAMNSEMQGNESGLKIYWPLNKEDHPVLKDKSGGGHSITLPSDFTTANWNSGAPVKPIDNSAIGELQVYLDGHKLTNLPETAAPAYPFAWEINSSSGITLPSEDIASLKHLRIYDSTASDEEIIANYKNGCLSPVGALAVQSTPLRHWGRFNIPAPGSETTVVAGSTVEKARYFIVPDHTLPTNYAYNSLNQVIRQSSPDGGASQFYYDKLGRLAVSQNAEQKQSSTGDPSGRYSYTLYDALGRIKEVGEKLGAGVMDEGQARTPNQLSTWLGSGSNRQVTLTAYDEAPLWAPASIVGAQHNLRKRVAATALLSTATASPDGSATDGAQNRLAASYYSYDVAGNVGDLYQENIAQSTGEKQYIAGTDGLKHVQYEYDLVSGKVNKVLYQPGKWDQFFYSYGYDGENRLTDVYTSRINYPSSAELTNWVKEAHYTYYLHGPLARVQLGKNNAQGLDYAYTLQGWLKGVNGQKLDGSDIAGDGVSGSDFSTFARDAVGFSLGYYHYIDDNGKEIRDYQPIGSDAHAFGLQYLESSKGQSGASLFNGNIAHATYAIQGIEGGATAGYSYRYDQLNRLVVMNRHQIGSSSTGWDNTSIVDAYKEKVTYDGNGNILTYFRNGANNGSLPLQMDDLTYGYNRDAQGRVVNNRLRHVKDSVSASNYSEDIDNQEEDNYHYDGIGNLTHDEAGKIDQIKWTVYGKIASIQKKDGTVITYGYDAGGNRIYKTVSIGTTSTTTYYVRDAQGNVLGIYNQNGTAYSWQEQDLYGSSRLGMLQPNVSIAATTPLSSDQYEGASDPVNNGVEGLRLYELTNHLGNVLATVTDRKIGVDEGGDATIDYYKAEVASAQDYYPFGMQMPERVFNNGSYKYGFNGKEKEISIGIDAYDYGMRISDQRIGKFLSVDPLTVKYPELTPYQFASNRPIEGVDYDGLEFSPGQLRMLKQQGESFLKKMGSNESIISSRGFINALTNANSFGTSDHLPFGLSTANLDEYDNEYEKQAYLTGRILGDVAAALQSASEVNGGLGEAVIASPSGVGAVPGLVVAGHGGLVGAAGFYDLNWALQKLKELGVNFSANADAKNSIEKNGNNQQNDNSNSSTNTSSQKGDLHHIATNKNSKSTVNGGPWTPRFKRFFDNANLDMDKGPENLIQVLNHQGPHPKEYHQLVFDRLNQATRGLKAKTDAYKNAVVNTLQQIAKEAQQVGSKVNLLITK